MKKKPAPTEYILNSSPLRYPGGKGKYVPILEQLMEKNGIENPIYIEAFAGGSGAAIRLLLNGSVNRVVLNDKDPLLVNFWLVVLTKSEKLIGKIKSTRVCITEWRRQREILRNSQLMIANGSVKLAFAYLYLNRCNRSGLMGSGPIGGEDQTGDYKINARFNKRLLIERIKRIRAVADKIEFHQMDAIDFLREKVSDPNYIKKESALLFLDPPYYFVGRDMYKHYFSDSDHQDLARFLNAWEGPKWIMSYDNVAQVSQLYQGKQRKLFKTSYSVHSARKEKELFVGSSNIDLSSSLFRRYVPT